MDIPVRPYRVEILFNEFMENLEKVHGWDYRDMAGKYKWMLETRERLCAEHNIDYAVWGYKAPADMDDKELEFQGIYLAEMKNTPEYQDVWHWLIDNAFHEVRNGSSECLSLELIDYPVVPDYVEKVFRAIFDAVPEDHPARSGDDINFYICW